MNIFSHFLFATALLLVSFTNCAAAIADSGSSPSYTVLYSSNVAGETEPCG